MTEQAKSLIQENKHHCMLLFHEAFQLDLDKALDLKVLLSGMVQKDKVHEAEQLVTNQPLAQFFM